MAELNDKYDIPNEFIHNDEFYFHEASEHASSVEAAQKLVRIATQAPVAEVHSDGKHNTEMMNLQGAKNVGLLTVEMRNYYLDGHIAA